ncbi:MAG: hypothetical protein IJ679_04720 [Lachnospiraceae bacterium]|nr:hypothetical protein [Lachnospiraceae bacterium]
MKKRLFSAVMALSLAAGAIVSTAVWPVREVEAGTAALPDVETFANAEAGVNDLSFEQEIRVDNVTSGNIGNTGIYIPSLSYTYHMYPVTASNLLPTPSSFYAKEQSDFPESKNPDKPYEHWVTITGVGRGQKSDSDGRYVAKINPEYLLENAGATTFTKTDVILRYQLTIGDIRIEGDDPNAPETNSVSLMQNTSGIAEITANDVSSAEGNLKYAVYCDMYINDEGHIGQVMFWNIDGSTKISGFSDTETNGGVTATDSTTASNDVPGIVDYKVYDAEVSTDYTGSAITADDFEYHVTFYHLPWWLSSNVANNANPSALVEQSQIGINKNNYAWSIDTGVVHSDDYMMTLKGKLDHGDQIFFRGIPLVGGQGLTDPPRFHTNVTFTNINGKNQSNNESEILKMVKRSFIGEGTRITSDIKTWLDFEKASIRSLYENLNVVASGNIFDMSSISVFTTMRAASSTDSSNCQRIVMFDPTDSIIVGVVTNFLPGVLMIVLALGGAIAFGLSRRKDDF